VASFSVHHGELTPLSAQNSASKGTCHVALDHTGRVLLAADYGGGSASSYLVTDGKLSPVFGANTTRRMGQILKDRKRRTRTFVVLADNRFAYFNDLAGLHTHLQTGRGDRGADAGGDISLKTGRGAADAALPSQWPHGYSINELDSTVDVLEWHKPRAADAGDDDSSAAAGYTGDTHGCDTVIKGGRFVYFANRGNNSLYLFHADWKTGSLTPGGRLTAGGQRTQLHARPHRAVGAGGESVSTT